MWAQLRRRSTRNSISSSPGGGSRFTVSAHKGFEATAGIREIEKSTGGHVPVIAMTAHAMKGDRERCLAAGMDGYVSKPIRPDELICAIGARPTEAPTVQA